MKINRMISKYNFSRGNSVTYIVIHDTGNAKDTAKANANYFNTGDRQASAHYFVDEKEIWQVVEEGNASWHCGDGKNRYGIGNYNSIGIEMCNSGGFTAEDTINNTLELVKALQSKYNISNDRVVRHYDASRKMCPGNMSTNNWAKWNEFKARLGGQAVPVQINNNIGGSYMSKLYKNGSTREDVFAEEKFLNKIGSLDPYECCEAIADYNGKIVVLYNGINGKKAGFVKYRGGL